VASEERNSTTDHQIKYAVRVPRALKSRVKIPWYYKAACWLMPSYSFTILQGRVILPSNSSANNNNSATPITEDSGHTSAWPKVCSCTLRCWMLELIFSCVAYWCRALIAAPGREQWTQERCACTKVHSSVSNTFIRMYLDRISEGIFFCNGKSFIFPGD
jgi:hypothetical protein